MIRFSFPIFLIACLPLASCSDQPRTSVPEATNEIAKPPARTAEAAASTTDCGEAGAALVELEEAYARALIAKDRAFLENYYAANFRGGNWMGFWTKSTMIKAVIDERYQIRKMELSDLDVRAVGQAGIVQGVSIEVTSVNGRDTSGRWTFTDIFECQNGQWRAVASHTAELDPTKTS